MLSLFVISLSVSLERKRKKEGKKTSDRSLTVHLGIILSNNLTRVSYSFRFILCTWDSYWTYLYGFTDSITEMRLGTI